MTDRISVRRIWHPGHGGPKRESFNRPWVVWIPDGTWLGWHESFPTHAQAITYAQKIARQA